MICNCDCLVLAAGISSRMGRWKMMLPLRDKTLIETTVETALRSCNRVIVVTGYRNEDLSQLFRANDRVVTVYNAAFTEGMFGSVKTGITMVTTEKWFLIPGDMPFVRPETYRTLFNTAESVDAYIPLYHHRTGHPVLMNTTVKKMVEEAPLAATLRTILSNSITLNVPVDDPGIVIDIDTENDFNRYVEKENNQHKS